jgi:hypothetical protein
MHSFLEINQPGLCGLTETWLDPNVLDYELVQDNYNFYRKDRIGRGGGLLLYVNKYIKSKRRVDLELDTSSSNEFIIVELMNMGINMFVLLFYRPPSSDVHFNNNF